MSDGVPLRLPEAARSREKHWAASQDAGVAPFKDGVMSTESSSAPASSSPSRLKAWLKLLFAVVFIWFFLWMFTPFWVSFSPVHQRFAAAQEDLGVPIGALYYNDLPFINDAAMVLRDTWRFLPRDMADKAQHRNGSSAN